MDDNTVVNEPKKINMNHTIINYTYDSRLQNNNNNVNNIVLNNENSVDTLQNSNVNNIVLNNKDSVNTPQTNNIVHTKAFVKYRLSDLHIKRHLAEDSIEDREEEAMEVSLLHFDKFDLILKSDDTRVPSVDTTAEVEVCKKLILGGTKTLHFLKLKFPRSGRRLAAQILPPWRSLAGVNMARMSGAAVLTKCPKDIFTRSHRRTIKHRRNNRR